MYKKAFELSYKNKKVEIEIQDFVGDVRNINGTEDLFSLSYISDSKDKGQSILVTEADINFYADDYFNIDELKTVGETDIKVKYYEDGALLWSGFVIPDFFSTSVDIAPVVSMVATDRVGTLKEISNNAESNIPIQILASCLKQTGQDLPINLIADNNHFETPIQLERIDEIASYDVIRSFMVLFNCKITLYKNAWWIINKKLLESGFVNYKSYNSDGAGGSVTPFAQPILDIDLVDRDGQREIKPTASEISLFLEFGGSKKYPDNWNFEKWNGTTFDNWTNHNGFSQGKRQTEIIFYTRIDGYYQVYLSEIETENKSLWYVARWYSNKLSDNILDYPNLKSSSVNVPKERGFIDIALNGNFTTRDGMPIWIVPLIHNKTNGNYFTYNKEGVILKIGSGTPNLNQSNFDYVHNPRAASQNGFNPDDMTHASVDVNWDIKNTFDLRDFGSDSDEIEMQVVFLGGIYLEGSLDYGTDVFLNAINISFNDSQVTGKGLIFKVKQGGEKFSKSRDPETILFSDKINQGVNGYFYNYKYDDTSIVDLPSEFALSSVRERADMFSKARDYYSLDGNFIVNPLAKYTCGLKSFVLIGGQNRREDAGIIVEEIVSNALNRTDFIYTYFDDGKDKVKSIGTASGGSSSSGGGGSSPSVPQLIKEDEEGNYYSEQPFYSLGGLSAFGFSEVGDGNGGGGIMNVIDNLTSTSKTDPLSANMGRYLKTLIDNIEVGEGGQVIVDWEAITGKPTTFAPSAHSHIIGDVTGLQGALDGKASLSQLAEKEDAFTKNTAFNKDFGTGSNDVARGNHTHAFSSLTSIPTTLSGYGITDAVTLNTAQTITGLKTFDANIILGINRYIQGTDNYTGVWNVDNLLWRFGSSKVGSVTNIRSEKVGIGTDTPAYKLDVSGTGRFTGTVTAPDVLVGGVTTSDKSLKNFINTFNSMFELEGDVIRAKKSLYSVGEISAFGLGEEGGGGGGSMNMMQAWSTSVETENYYLPAKLAVPFYNNTRSRLSTLEAGTAPASHTHPISDITNLQTALNSKLETTVFNTHNTDNIRHITGAERTKWDGVVTDFAGLEIGGRNLLLNSEVSVTNANYNRQYLSLSEQTIVGQRYTFSIRCDDIKGGLLDIYDNDTIPGGSKHIGTLTFISGNIYGVTFNAVDSFSNMRVRNNGNRDNPITTYESKLEKGNKPTDWSPAPEDQVSDWNITDVNSFSFIKNKPTKLSDFTDNIGIGSHIANSVIHITGQERINWNLAYNERHTHPNKSVIDQLTQADINVLEKLSLVDGNLRIDATAYSTGNLSAFGLEEEGGGSGGGAMNMMQGWTFTTETENYYLPAKLAVPFYNETRSRLTTLEGGSATTVNVSGAGDLLASVSKVGNNINFIKGNQSWNNLSGKPSTFAPSAHSHPISDITNLQTALNNKLETSVFNTHNNDNIRHITGAERTKWNDAFNRGDFRDFGLGNTPAKILSELGAIDNDINTLPRGINAFIFPGSAATNVPGVSSDYPIGLRMSFNVNLGATLLFGRTGNDKMWFRNDRNGVGNFNPWREVWHDGNLTSLSQLTDNIGVATHIANKANPHGVTTAQIGAVDLTTNQTIIAQKTFDANIILGVNRYIQGTDNYTGVWNVDNKLWRFGSSSTGSASNIRSEKVGIGTDSPTEKLDVIGNIKASGTLTALGGNSSNWNKVYGDFNEMFRKVGTSIEAKLPLYSLGGLSAYGFSDEGSSSGGGIVNILSSWESYDTSKSGWALSAGLGENLRTRVVTLENAEIDLSGYATLNYVNDKVKTNVPLNAKFTDTIVDISGKVDKKTGFSLVADTEITRLSSVTNQDLTPYALKTYVDTEVGKKWTYNETTIKAVKVSNAVRADNVGGFTVGIDVPDNAKFTDTIVDISGKVDKVAGKGLSTNDFTTVEKNKLAILENQTRESLGVDNVTNESKATIFTNPTFTGTTKVTILELNSNWKFVKVGNNIELQYNGVTKQIMTNNGDIIATAGVTAYQ